jgi:hypothetical protein
MLNQIFIGLSHMCQIFIGLSHMCQILIGLAHMCQIFIGLAHMCPIFIGLAHWNNSRCADMSLHFETLSRLRANQSLLLLLNDACLAEKQQIPIL